MLDILLLNTSIIVVAFAGWKLVHLIRLPADGPNTSVRRVAAIASRVGLFVVFVLIAEPILVFAGLKVLDAFGLMEPPD